MDINYLGTVYAVRCCLPSMKSRRKGRIVCVSSVGGLVGLYGYTAYGGSKVNTDYYQYIVGPNTWFNKIIL